MALQTSSAKSESRSWLFNHHSSAALGCLQLKLLGIGSVSLLYSWCPTSHPVRAERFTHPARRDVLSVVQHIVDRKFYGLTLIQSSTFSPLKLQARLLLQLSMSPKLYERQS